MAQLSLRLNDELHRRATFAAQAAGTSLNAYIAKVLQIAVDPSSSEPEGDRIRQRLFEAGLLPTAAVPPGPSADDQADFIAARAAAGQGTSGSDLIASERRER